ncbi:MAG: hypothetical protein KGN79_16390 [Acidobacteriota bacterium]|nr:hypothetical protein [Acidobacteriota bacterium]
MPERKDDLNSMINKLWPILVRRRMWIILTFLTVALVTTIVALKLPAKYRSEATILVQSQSAPNQLVISNSTANTMEDLDPMTDKILSRTHLLQVIDEFHLYPGLRHDMDPNELATLMRNNIELTPMNKNPERRSVNALMVAYTASNPEVAQKVTNRLTSLFIEGNQQAIQGKDTGMTSFLSSELAQAKAELDRQEAIVRDFKMRNLGQLPEQQQGNMEILSGLQTQLQAAQTSLGQARQQKAYLDAMLAQPTPVTPETANQANDEPPSPTVALQTELVQLRSQRQDLLSRYSPLYPDVVSLNQRIADDEAQLKRLQASAPARSKTHTAASNTSSPAVAQLKSQLEANRLQISEDQRRISDLQGQISAYQGRLNLAPVRAQQLSEVMRNYDQAKQRYTDLQNKQGESELATNLAKKQIDAQFQVIDTASLPSEPANHQRVAIALGGFFGGLVLGIVLAFLVEARHPTFHNDKELKQAFSVPLIVALPPFRTQNEIDKQTSRKRMEWLLATTATLIILAAQAYIVHRG